MVIKKFDTKKLAPIKQWAEAGVIQGLRPANERWRYFVTTSLIGWVQT